MTVSKLISELRKCDPTDLVVLSTDPEGNEMREAGTLNLTEYAYDRSEREIGLRELNDDLVGEGYSEGDVAPEGSRPCVVIWPN